MESISSRNLEDKESDELDDPTDDLSVEIDEQLKLMAISAQALESQCDLNALLKRIFKSVRRKLRLAKEALSVF